MKLFVSVFVFAALISAGASAQGKVQLPEVLIRAIRASKILRYSGTRVVEFRRGPGPERDRHVEFVTKDGPKSRIDFEQDGPFRGQVVVEDERERRHFFPQRNEIVTSPARKDAALGRLGLLVRRKQEFRVQSSEGEKVAGLATTLITVADLRGNPLQMLWIYPRNGMILKRLLLDPIGGRVGSFEFTQVSFDPKVSSEDFVLRRNGARVVTPLDELRQICRDSRMLEVSLGPTSGLALEDSRLERRGGRDVLIQSYVGGESGPLSLFQTTGAVDVREFERMARQGNFNVYVWNMRGRSFALVGEQTREELEKLAQSAHAR